LSKRAGLKEWFRDRLGDAVKDEFGAEISSLNDIQRSIAMTTFYVRNVLRTISPTLVPSDDDDLEYCIVDGKNDEGVDFVFKNEDRVLIIQAKYRGKRSIEDFNEFDSFCNVISRVHAKQSRGSIKNRSLSDAIADIDWHNDRFELQFISLGKRNDKITDRQREGQMPVTDLPDIEFRTNIEFYDETDLNKSLRDALHYEDFIQEQIEIPFVGNEEGPPWLIHESSEHRRCLVGLVSGSQIYNLVERYRSRLFNLNIRNFLGELATNKDIISTAVQDADNFFFYNNGVSAVATEIDEDRETGCIHCKGFSIINGAQTVNSIHRAITRDPSQSASSVEVLFRISEIDFRKDNPEGGFIDSITRFNNTQNAIKLPDFRSNDSIQLAIRSQFERLPALEGKKFFYKNKRSGEQKRNRIAIGMEEFAKSVHSVLYGPPDYFGGTKYLFDTSPGKGYAKLFGDGDRVDENLSRESFRVLAGAYFLTVVTKEFYAKVKATLIEREAKKVKDGKLETPTAKNALERKWLVYFVVGRIVAEKARISESDLNASLKKLASPNWMKNEDKRSAIDTYVKFACETLVKLYTSEQKDPNFTHRNWYRSEAILDKIEYEIELSESTLEHLDGPF